MTWTANYTDNRTGENKTHHMSGHDGEAERRVALPFNPSGHEETWQTKIACCAAMKTIERHRDATRAAFARREQEIAESKPAKVMDVRERYAFEDALRGFATALTHLQTASMFAVSALHARANAGLSD